MTMPAAEPHFFGPSERPLFGILHRAATHASPPLGLIICNPFGFEAICAHRSLRHIAQEAAERGIPALRFDYDGTGDSAGSDAEPRRLSAWVRSVQDAAQALRGATGCRRFAFLGVRLGATIAALAAAERDDVDSVVAIAPVVNARAYVRELRAMQRASTATAGAAQTQGPDLLEAMGFPVSAETRDELSAVDLVEQTRLPARRVLLIERDDLPSGEKWCAELSRLGAHVERHVAPGYVEMMFAPHSSVVPRRMLDLTGAFLLERRRALAQDASPASIPLENPAGLLKSSVLQASAPDSTTRVRESAEFIDESKTVFGVLTVPQSEKPRAAIVLLNAGATHHIGPSRLYVTLARQWASLGYAVFRMDVSGLGDSRPHDGEPENVVYTRRAGEDITLAADWLRKRTGVADCFALGLCAGAYHGFKAAVRGVALSGVVLINPLTFFWKDGMSLDEKLADQRVIAGAAYYRKNVFSGQTWARLFRGEVNLLNVLQVVMTRVGVSLRHGWRELARRLHLELEDDLGRELDCVAGRGTKMLFVFADDEPGIELLRLQGGSTVGRLRDSHKLEVKIIPGADHTFTAWQSREQLASYLIAAMTMIAP